MFCIYNYKDEIKQLRRIPGKEAAHAQAYHVNINIIKLLIVTNFNNYT